MRPTVLTFFLLLFIIIFTWNIQALPYLISYRNKKETLNDDQCIPVDFYDGQVGLVNVIAFLDSSWPFSYKQADMLKMLKDRLEHSGMPEVLFFAVINDFSSTEDPEDNLEEMTWTNVAPEEVLEIQNIFGNWSRPGNEALELLKEIISPDIFVIEDTENLGISRNFNGSRDQVLVIDRCGKMTYQIIVPWSILHFPYVKAAILSTYKDDPCGPCDAYATVVNFDQLSSTANIRSKEGQLEEMIKISKNDLELAENRQLDHSGDFSSTVEDQSTAMNLEKASEHHYDDLEDLERSVPSLKIVMHAPHYHINEDAHKKHEYLVLEWSKSNYHGHLDGPDAYVYNRDTRTNAGVLIDSIYYEKNESPGTYGEIADYWKESSLEKNPEENDDDAWNGSSPKPPSDSGEVIGNSDQDGQNLITALMNSELVAQEEEEEESDMVFGKNNNEEENIKEKLISHYSKLLPWIYYVLND